MDPANQICFKESLESPPRVCPVERFENAFSYFLAASKAVTFEFPKQLRMLRGELHSLEVRPPPIHFASHFAGLTIVIDQLTTR